MTNSISSRWSEKDINLLKKFYGEITLDEICTLVNKTPSAVTSKVHYLRKRGYTFNTTRR